ncbi:MAG: hypothetical protein WB511_01775 [Nitrososphaeraceae archaeon]
MEDKNSFSLIVNELELQDRSRRIARIHLEVMDFLKISEGDLIDICGDNNIMTTVCLSHPPTSDDKTVIRIGEEIRNHIGIQVGEKIVIRKHTESLINEEVNEKMKTISHPTLIISGSCINFEKELPRILDQLRSLQLEVHIEDDAIFRCYSDGEKTLGWDFFQISIDPIIIDRLLEIHPEINKNDGMTPEEKFVPWLSSRFRRRNQEYYLKVKQIPFESTQGFRLDPQKYREIDERDNMK